MEIDQTLLDAVGPPYLTASYIGYLITSNAGVGYRDNPKHVQSLLFYRVYRYLRPHVPLELPRNQGWLGLGEAK